MGMRAAVRRLAVKLHIKSRTPPGAEALATGPSAPAAEPPPQADAAGSRARRRISDERSRQGIHQRSIPLPPKKPDVPPAPSFLSYLPPEIVAKLMEKSKAPEALGAVHKMSLAAEQPAAKTPAKPPAQPSSAGSSRIPAKRSHLSYLPPEILAKIVGEADTGTLHTWFSLGKLDVVQLNPQLAQLFGAHAPLLSQVEQVCDEVAKTVTQLARELNNDAAAQLYGAMAPEQLQRLVETALDAVATSPEDKTKAAALMVALPAVMKLPTEDQRVALFHKVLDTADTLSDNDCVSLVLEQVATALLEVTTERHREALIEKMLLTGCQHDEDETAVELAVKTLGGLSEACQLRLLEKIFAAAKNSPNDYSLSKALAELAKGLKRLSEKGPCDPCAGLADQLLAAARAIRPQIPKAHALIAVLKGAPTEGAKITMTKEIMALINLVKDGYENSALLKALAPALMDLPDGPQRAACVQNMRTQAGRIREPARKADALVALLPILKASSQEHLYADVLEEALDAASTSLNLADQHGVLKQIVPAIADVPDEGRRIDLIQKVLLAHGDSAQALTQLTPILKGLPTQSERAVLAEAVAHASSTRVRDESAKVKVQVALAPVFMGLSQEGRATDLLADMIEASSGQAKAMKKIVPVIMDLPDTPIRAGLADKVETAIRAIQDKEGKSYALIALASIDESRQVGLIEDVLADVMTIPEDSSKAKILRRLIPVLAGLDDEAQAGLMQKIREATPSDETHHVTVLAAMAGFYSEKIRGAAV
jgi:hypothetical protein